MGGDKELGPGVQIFLGDSIRHLAGIEHVPCIQKYHRSTFFSQLVHVGSFLGKTANIAPGLGVFAYSSKVPVIPVVIRRRGWAHHEWTVHPPIYPDPEAERDDEVLRITTEVLAIMDRAIRKEPGQYFWYNRRWVLQPVKNYKG
jgi:lauroyl/myristoyl acyltransferase